MKDILIDVGANKGQMVSHIRKERPYQDWEIHCFEPCIDALNISFKFKRDKKVILNKTLAWTYDGEADIYLDRSSRHLGSSVDKTKITGVIDVAPTKVKCIDLYEYIKPFHNDYVILKLNIEGAEYKLLPYMLEKREKNEEEYPRCLEDIVDEIYVDWHWRKLKTVSRKEHMKLHEELKRRFGDDYKIFPGKVRDTTKIF